jgi:hypothetical protein
MLLVESDPPQASGVRGSTSYPGHAPEVFPVDGQASNRHVVQGSIILEMALSASSGSRKRLGISGDPGQTTNPGKTAGQGNRTPQQPFS